MASITFYSGIKEIGGNKIANKEHEIRFQNLYITKNKFKKLIF